MRVQGTPEGMTSIDDIVRAMTNLSDELKKFSSRGIRIDDNFDQKEYTVSDSGGADAEITITHELGRTPIGFIVKNINKGGSVYDSGTTWTATTMYLKCSAANATITLYIY